MDDSPRILYELDGKYPYIAQTLVNEPDLFVEMNTMSIYNSFVVTGTPEAVYYWVLEKQVELFREGVEVAVFNRNDLDNGRVKVAFGAKFPEEDRAA
ncbi:MAG: hypothetical protein QNJ55_25150 [Xenococcus sp. MO_188.B8]|nr:hypothetical protein [Xenococcus sp. MO_188.B8]